MAATRSFLSHAEFFALTKFLEPQKPHLLKYPKTPNQLASEATASLKFTVAESNIRSACKILGISLRHGNTNSGHGGVIQLWRLLRLLTKSHYELARKMGEDVDPDLVRFAVQPSELPTQES